MPDAAQNRLGCFGSTVVRATEHPMCVACRDAADCMLAATANRAALRAELGVADLPAVVAGPKKPSATRAPVAKVAGLTTKGHGFVASLARHGLTREAVLEIIALDAPTRAARTRDLKPAFARVVFDRLAASERLEKSELRAAFERELNWSRGTAASHVAIAANALAHLGVVTDAGDALTRRVA